MAKMEAEIQRARYCPQCGEVIEAISKDFAYFHRDVYTGNHALVVGNQGIPDGMSIDKTEPAPAFDKYTVEPCGDELTSEEVAALKASYE
jgi:hypothetical protein